MSSGQSLRNGSSVEPGLPNTRLMPNARKRPKVASCTVSAALEVLADLRDDIGRRSHQVSCVPPSLLGEDGAIHVSMDCFTKSSRPAKTNKEAPRASPPFSSEHATVLDPCTRMRSYFWMQVSAVSLVHSSRPVNTGSSTFLPSIRSIMTDGAL